jgi:hypothetical protein
VNYARSTTIKISTPDLHKDIQKLWNEGDAGLLIALGLDGLCELGLDERLHG